MTIRDDFLATARSAAALLRDPAVAAGWNTPSALPEFGVAGLAGHLAFQVLAVPEFLAGPVPTEETIGILEHYNRAQWIDAEPDAEINRKIRDGGHQLAADGPPNLADRVDDVIAGLAETLPKEPARPVRISLWGPWSLMLDDLLVTRMMELAVHSDDLAVSVGIPTPALPEQAVETVVDLLSRLAVRRHGPTAVLRALTRAERAPTTITAF
ncbi:maleylpyruvate isomerase N-terminal domain-containing protein [Kribbella sp. NBC_01245]|uniref:maleylpyruvate isomerase N-terminal domain-containing protein n=1 Tax=Kribbella sp. NBC_01245 TaxID=2903578 RepID=UPI002E2A03F1|nr:maleylpyruvate isomerase N-terminal domain-containing protein [Kribbella sp. NBC_01245]